MLPGLGGAAAPQDPAAPPALDPRLKPAAHEFEASLMKELLEPLQHDPLFDDRTDSESSDGSGNALVSFGSEALAKAISDRGGFGIANKILAHFAQQPNHAGKTGIGG
jgi:flagellar protein FlgJ